MNEGSTPPSVLKSSLALRAAAKAEKREKWSVEVRTMKAGVFQGYRQLVLSDKRRFRIFWRSLKGRGFWVTAKGYEVYFGRTLHSATLKLAEVAEL